jgi:hypothetical protein
MLFVATALDKVISIWYNFKKMIHTLFLRFELYIYIYL